MKIADHHGQPDSETSIRYSNIVFLCHLCSKSDNRNLFTGQWPLAKEKISYRGSSRVGSVVEIVVCESTACTTTMCSGEDNISLHLFGIKI